MSEPNAEPPERCSYCGADLVVVHVHGHGQCQACGTNVAPCCSGANPGSEPSQPHGDASKLDRESMLRAFVEVGGDARATVTESAYLFALARILDISLDEARVVLEAAVDLAIVRRSGVTVRAG